MKRPFDLLLEEAQHSLGSPVPSLPWDKGWLGATLGRSPAAALFPVLSRPNFFGPGWRGCLPGPRGVGGENPGPTTWDQVVREVRRCRPGLGAPSRRDPVDLDPVRLRAVRRWLLLLSMAPEAFLVGRQLEAARVVGASVDEMENILVDVFAPKATGTLDRRAGSLALFVAWCDEHDVGSPLPVRETLAYDYIKYLGQQGAPATRADSFLQALRFSEAVLGLSGVEEVVGSARIVGAAFNCFVKKRPLRQRAPLTVAQVLALEDFVIDGHEGHDRVAAGAFLFVLFSRARFGDASYGEAFSLDLSPSGAGYIECKTSRCKTARSKEKKRMVLPLVGPVLGVGKRPWAQAWVAARAAMGLDGPSALLLPAPAGPGAWAARRVTTCEAGRWLRLLLEQLGREGDRPGELGTHSLKTTTLAWCARFGLDHDTRRLLGGHVVPGDASMLTYSRDAMAAPLRALERVLGAIRESCFDPDCTRSGLFSAAEAGAFVAASPDAEPVTPASPPSRSWTDVDETAAPEQEEVAVQECGTLGAPAEGGKGLPAAAADGPGAAPEGGPAGPAGSAESSSSSSASSASGTEDSSSEEDRAALVAVERVASRGPCRAAGDSEGRWFRHLKVGTFHLAHPRRTGTLACGRPVGRAYSESPSPAFPWPRCRICFGGGSREQ